MPAKEMDEIKMKENERVRVHVQSQKARVRIWANVTGTFGLSSAEIKKEEILR